MWCILKIENYPDRVIEAAYGPYASEVDARAIAKDMYDDPDNLNAPYNHRLSRFEVIEMENI